MRLPNVVAQRPTRVRNIAENRRRLYEADGGRCRLSCVAKGSCSLMHKNFRVHEEDQASLTLQNLELHYQGRTTKSLKLSSFCR